MKKLLLLLFVIPMLFNSCNAEDGTDGIDGTDGVDGRNGIKGVDGVDGVNGIDGEDGQDGSNLQELFQVTIDFNAENNFETFVELPTDIQIGSKDIVFVYILTEVLNVGAKGTLPPKPPVFVWEALPKTMYIENRELAYGFKYSLNHLRLFLDGSVDLNELPSELTQGIIFRVAVIPATWVSSAYMDNLDAMISSMPNNEIKVLN